MLNFRNTSLVLIFFAVFFGLLLSLGVRPGMFPLLPVIAWLFLLALGSVKICMNFYVKAFCKGKTDEKVMALTFDDGPEPEVTPFVLEILKKHNIPAAFFVIGRKAEQFPELIGRIREEGHTIGLHSFSHAIIFDLYGRKKMERDLEEGWKGGKVEEWKSGRVEKWKGGKGVLFRPPYGVTNPTVAGVVKKLGLVVVGWSIRSLDTTIRDPQKVAARIRKRLHPGAVVLMHDTRKDLPEILEQVIREAKESGYRFVGVEEMIKFQQNIP